MKSIVTVNPSDQTILAEYPADGPDQVEAKVQSALTSWDAWRRTPVEVRSTLMRRLADLVEERVELLAREMALEMGKPIVQARAEAHKCAWVCRHYAETAAAGLEPTPVEVGTPKAAVHHHPLGPILGIMPWNFPLWQVFRFAAPTLMAGNVVLLKHAPNVTGCARHIADLFRDAGFPTGAFEALYMFDLDAVGRLIDDRRVAGVTLTGSVKAGRSVAARAGAALKPHVLELGGSDPFVVLEDADVECAAKVGAASRLLNAGQSCIAAKRMIVHERVHDRFVEALVAEFEQAQVGEPLNESTTLGPLAREDLRRTLDSQVQHSVSQGAVLTLGRSMPDGPGFYYPPTILTGITADHPAGVEETFGPVAAVTKVRSIEEAVRVANHTSFGLGCSVWTRDLEVAHRLAAELAAGAVFINEMVKSDPRVPFGGIKDSGIGRELGLDGLLSFTNTKTVWAEIGQG